MLSVGRTTIFEPMTKRDAPFAKFYLDDLVSCKKELAKTVEVLGELIKEEIIARGHDPEDPEIEIELNGVCSMSLCRTICEELYERLEIMRQTAIINAVGSKSAVN